jgi:hypothetical protein
METFNHPSYYSNRYDVFVFNDDDGDESDSFRVIASFDHPHDARAFMSTQEDQRKCWLRPPSEHVRTVLEFLATSWTF